MPNCFVVLVLVVFVVVVLLLRSHGHHSRLRTSSSVLFASVLRAVGYVKLAIGQYS